MPRDEESFLDLHFRLLALQNGLNTRLWPCESKSFERSGVQ